MFKLLELEFYNHPFLKNLLVKFCSDKEENKENYTSLIIGPNGTGKSQILLGIINIFNSIAILKQSDRRSYKFQYSYRCKYNYNGEIVEIGYNDGQLTINNEHYRYQIDYLPLPKKLLVSSYSFNDKYPLRQNRGKILNKDYYYLGLKSTTNNIFIFNPPKDSIDNLCSAIHNGRDVRLLAEAFSILDLKPEIKVIYKPGRHFKYLQSIDWNSLVSITPDAFIRSFRKFVDSKKRKKIIPEIEQKRLGDEKISRVLEEEHEKNVSPLIDYLKLYTQQIISTSNKQLDYKPYINFSDLNTIDRFAEHVIPFRTMRDLEIISFERFEINKLESGFAFDNASSGEYHILLTFLNLLSLIEENSLVLIDEPEISLHPNWQIRYMDIFNKIFQNYRGAHFIISSHSHFLVSDFKSSNSFIGSLYYDNSKGRTNFKEINRNTYGWSAEQILLEVFNVATTRNYYITKIVTDSLKELSKETPNYNMIKDTLREIVELDISNLRNNDPLKEILPELVNIYNEL